MSLFFKRKAHVNSEMLSRGYNIPDFLWATSKINGLHTKVQIPLTAHWLCLFFIVYFIKNGKKWT